MIASISNKDMQVRDVGRAMSKIDVDELREYMTDYCGTAMFGGLSAAVLDLSDMDQMSGEELCRKAEELNVDLRDFEVYE